MKTREFTVEEKTIINEKRVEISFCTITSIGGSTYSLYFDDFEKDDPVIIVCSSDLSRVRRLSNVYGPYRRFTLSLIKHVIDGTTPKRGIKDMFSVLSAYDFFLAETYRAKGFSVSKGAKITKQIGNHYTLGDYFEGEKSYVSLRFSKEQAKRFVEKRFSRNYICLNTGYSSEKITYSDDKKYITIACSSFPLSDIAIVYESLNNFYKEKQTNNEK